MAGDRELADLFSRFDGRLISPGGAAMLLGVTRQTVYTLGKRGALRVFRSDRRTSHGDGLIWVYIPLDDVYAYGERVGRPVRPARPAQHS